MLTVARDLSDQVCSRGFQPISVNLPNCERIGTPVRACVSDPLPLRGRPPLQGGHYILPLRRRQGGAHTRPHVSYTSFRGSYVSPYGLQPRSGIANEHSVSKVNAGSKPNSGTDEGFGPRSYLHMSTTQIESSVRFRGGTGIPLSVINFRMRAAVSG